MKDRESERIALLRICALFFAKNNEITDFAQRPGRTLGRVASQVFVCVDVA
jgi:hypothetical protein